MSSFLIWSIDKILTSNNQDQRVVLSMEELEKLDLPKLLTALSLSEEDLEKKPIDELNKIYKKLKYKNDTLQDVFLYVTLTIMIFTQ